MQLLPIHHSGCWSILQRKLTKDERDGEVFGVYQTPSMVQSGKPCPALLFLTTMTAWAC